MTLLYRQYYLCASVYHKNASLARPEPCAGMTQDAGDHKK